MNPKITIAYSFKKGPWGGGNQFLKGLKKKFISWGVYEENPDKADIVLFNSFPSGELYRFKQAYLLKKNRKVLIHRVDGPISEIRNSDLDIDKVIYRFNNFFADGTIFQSKWSRRENYKLGMKGKKLETVIINAPDSQIFNKRGKIKFSPRRKIRLIATSWSDNWRKGFRVYKYLDENLDFSRYEMTFIGNSPTKFKNINWIKPLPSKELAKQLKRHDIFITASQKDPCSNSLIEALHCGLPAVALNDGGHPEIIKSAGELFNSKNDIIPKINLIADHYNQYQRAISLPSLHDVAKKYYLFAEKVFNYCKQKKRYHPKINKYNYYQIRAMAYTWEVKSKLRKILNF